MAFEPKQHLIQLGGKDYLEVRWRLVWLREEHPAWGVETELLQLDAVAIVKASIKDETGRVIASGHGMAKTGGSAKWAGREIEKAETAAIGRALAHAGIGTQFIDDETEGEGDHDHIADSPVDRKSSNPPKQQRTTQPAANPPATQGASVLDTGFSVETGRNFLGWAKRNYGLSEEGVSKILDAISNTTLASITQFPGTVLDAVSGVMLADLRVKNIDISDALKEMSERRNKFIAPHGKPFTLVEVEMIGKKMNELAKGE